MERILPSSQDRKRRSEQLKTFICMEIYIKPKSNRGNKLKQNQYLSNVNKTMKNIIFIETRKFIM